MVSSSWGIFEFKNAQKQQKKKKKKKSLFKRLSFPEKLREGVYSQIRCLRDEHVCVVEISGYFLKVMV